MDTEMSLNQTSGYESVARVPSTLEQNMDAFFLIIISMVVFFMQSGFAFFEAGSVRSKNTTNILIKNFLSCFVGCFIYWAVGYALAFGEGNGFVGLTGWFGNFPPSEKHKWIFQFIFAATSSTIVSGSVAERCEVWPYFVYSIFITGFVYPLVSRWAWYKSGWLVDRESIIEGIKYQDFAGSGVVHLTGGTAALFGAIFCGPRLGRFEMGQVSHIPGHSMPLAAIGAFILIFGFLAFNGGSQSSISQPGDGEAVATAVMNTMISGMGAAISNLTITKFSGFLIKKRYGNINKKSNWRILTTINGALVGMVAIGASSNRAPSWAAAVIGVISSFFYFTVTKLLVKLRIDDPLDAVAVHAGGGLWGVIAASLFVTKRYNKIGQQFTVNLIGALAIIAWTSVWSIGIFGIMKAVKVLRVPRVIELRGMDTEKHGEHAYPVAAWKEAWGEFADTESHSSKTSRFMATLERNQQQDQAQALAQENAAFDDETNIDENLP